MLALLDHGSSRRFALSAHCLLWAALATGLTLSAPALADEPEDAGKLWDRGLNQMIEGEYETACRALAKSQLLSPRVDKAFTVAECFEKGAQFVRAANAYRDYLEQVSALTPDQQAAEGDRQRRAEERLKDLRREVATLTIVLASSAPPGATVLRDGVQLRAKQLGLPIFLSPGPHEIVVRDGNGDGAPMQVTLEKGKVRKVIAGAAVAASTPPEETADAPTPTGVPKSRLKSPGLFAGGIVMSALGGLGVGLTSMLVLVECGSPEYQSKGCAPTAAGLGASVLLLGGGVVSLVMGGPAASPGSARQRYAPTVAIGPGSGTLRWSF